MVFTFSIWILFSLVDLVYGWMQEMPTELPVKDMPTNVTMDLTKYNKGWFSHNSGYL